MKIKNFNLLNKENQQIIEIEYLGKILDLHNSAEFLKVEYEIKSNLLILYWNYYFDYFNKDNYIPFQIKFEGTHYFEIQPRDIEIPEEEDDCLKEILCNENLEFKFMGGMNIFVKSDYIFLVFDQNEINKIN